MRLPLEEVLALCIAQRDVDVLDALASEVQSLPAGSAALQKLLQFRDKNVSSLLHLAAAAGGSQALVRSLIDAGADPNYPRSTDGNTALHEAVSSKDADCVRELLAAGAQPFLQNVAGQTPLDVALERRLSTVCRDLQAAALFCGCITFKTQSFQGLSTGWKRRWCCLFQATRSTLATARYAALRWILLPRFGLLYCRVPYVRGVVHSWRCSSAWQIAAPSPWPISLRLTVPARRPLPLSCFLRQTCLLSYAGQCAAVPVA